MAALARRVQEITPTGEEVAQAQPAEGGTEVMRTKAEAVVPRTLSDGERAK
jgi:hypothetical protein